MCGVRCCVPYYRETDGSQPGREVRTGHCRDHNSHSSAVLINLTVRTILNKSDSSSGSDGSDGSDSSNGSYDSESSDGFDCSHTFDFSDTKHFQNIQQKMCNNLPDQEEE